MAYRRTLKIFRINLLEGSKCKIYIYTISWGDNKKAENNVADRILDDKYLDEIIFYQLIFHPNNILGEKI